MYLRYVLYGNRYYVYRFFIISLFVFVWEGGIGFIGTFVLGSLGWYILLGLGFVILCTLFCFCLGGVGGYPHCV